MSPTSCPFESPDYWQCLLYFSLFLTSSQLAKIDIYTSVDFYFRRLAYIHAKFDRRTYKVTYRLPRSLLITLHFGAHEIQLYR